MSVWIGKFFFRMLAWALFDWKLRRKLTYRQPRQVSSVHHPVVAICANSTRFDVSERGMFLCEDLKTGKLLMIRVSGRQIDSVACLVPLHHAVQRK